MQPTGETTTESIGDRRPSSRTRWDATDLSLVAVFAALIAALAIVPGIPVGPLGVPITLQTLGVMLAGVVLGPARGTAAVLLYLAAGLIGLPVFSGFSGGFGVLAGPSAGYLLAFPLAALVAGAFARLILRGSARFRTGLLFLGCLAASLLTIHPLGIAGLMVNAGLPLREAVIVDAAYLPGDVVKNVLAAILAVSVHRAFPRLLGGRGR
ncbi:biotin transporter BioY [Arthrobacter agilis]|uniref:biotin transporter BioY n=1 Tax=Arthrobacter agilis TaxID=37921 RepID=UPI000B359C06|nr:biotin transporter BioY [Arthrobacter agilis]OUM44513.1 BioY family transporter [Arthrobacter agilis]PPB47418.1 biotin transporter BioY [Arthrobacter agilis]TPV22790.1 biotin transporter BioY [Arthrobacter agilis]VDR32039.1 Biotin ECF transporter S component BioY [Arthrobacter agilis]